MEYELEGRVGAIIARKDVADAIFRDGLVPGSGGLVCCNADGRWTWLHSGGVNITSEIEHILAQSAREWVLIAPGFGRVLTTVKYGRSVPEARSAWDSVPMARQGSICDECECDCDDDCGCGCGYCDSCECEAW